MQNIELINLAKMAAKNAYAPYSNHTVGSALKCKNGKIYTGCNVENVAFSPTNCAERTAFFKAISDGEREFEKIAIVGGKNLNFENYFPPCGVCRQVMMEFCENDFEIILGKNDDKYLVKTLDEILPLSFSAVDFKK